jgi:hypothetical protein
MGGEPGAALGQQLLDLLGVDVVVLLQVEHRDQHVEMVEEVGEAAGRLQPQRHIRARPPLRHRRVERQRLDRDRVAERCEQALDKAGAAAHRQRRHHGAERERLLHQLRALRAAAAERGAQRLGDRHRQERGCRIGPVVDVLIEQASILAAAAAADEADRIDVEHQDEGAALLVRLGIEHVRAPEGQLQLVAARRVLVQEIAKVRGRPVSRRDRKQHRVDRSPLP